MRYLISITFLILLFSACGPSGDLTVNELLNDKSFNPVDFFKSKISIYSPYVLTFSKYKYPNIESKDINSVILNNLKEKLEDISDNQNIFIENKKAPDYFKGIKNIKAAGKELLSTTNSDYFVVIQYALIGSEMEVRQAMLDLEIDTPIGVMDLSGDDNLKPKISTNSAMDNKFKIKQTTQTTICYDIWDVKKGVSVYTSEASIVLTDGLNHKNPFTSIEKVTEALIDKIVGSEE